MAIDNPQTVSLVAGSATVFFTERYSYVEFQNESASDAMWVRADGQAAVVEADGSAYVGPGETTMIADGLPMWFQGFGGPDGPSNPGISISVVGTGTDTFSVIGR